MAGRARSSWQRGLARPGSGTYKGGVMNDGLVLMPSAPAAPDFAEARDRMVDGQVRPNKIIDPRIIQAMRRLPRERFVPAALSSRAYADEAVMLPGGRALMEPMVIARLVQILRVREGERGLVVGAGTGYGAAVLAASGVAVIALEDDAALLSLARSVLPEVAPGVVLVEGPVAAGWAQGGPYDFILIEGAVTALPEVLAGQLRPHGRVAAVLAYGGDGRAGGAWRGLGQGVLAELVHVGAETRLRAQPFFDCATPMLPQLRPQAGFTF